MMPSRSTSTCRARAAGKDFPSIMEDHRWFARARPGVLAASLENQAIFRLKCHFQQAHVVLLLEGTQCQHCAHDGCCFHTNEHRRVNLTGDRNPVGSDNIEFHAVFIHLS